MADISNELIYKLVQQVQASQEAITHKIGAIAGTLVTVQRDIRSLQRDVTGLKDSVATHAIAADERLDRIEKKLDLTHA
jgi:hypothetical protein